MSILFYEIIITVEVPTIYIILLLHVPRTKQLYMIWRHLVEKYSNVMKPTTEHY